MAESSNEKYKIPTGLRPLLEALARETLRTQPVDLIDFSQLFFNILQKHRTKNSGDILSDPILYESFRDDLQKEYQNNEHQISEQLPSPANEAATKIQAAFRGHMVRSFPEKFGIDKETDILRRQFTEQIDVQKAQTELNFVPEGDTTEDQAATKIQAEIRGFLARRQVQQMKKDGDEAAKKIQAHIRGYLTRKHLDEARITPKHSTIGTSSSLHNLHKINNEEMGEKKAE